LTATEPAVELGEKACGYSAVAVSESPAETTATGRAALWEAVGLGGATGHERRARAEEAARSHASIPEGSYGNVTWAAGALFAGTADDRCEFGLTALLDGFEARLATGESRQPR
jgi:hypothetical protein